MYLNFKSPTAAKMFKRDGVSVRHYIIVYTGHTVRNVMGAALVGSYIISFVSACMLVYYGYQKYLGYPGKKIDPYEWDHNPDIVFLVIMIGVAWSWLIITIARRRILRIYYNKSAREFLLTRLNVCNPTKTVSFTCKAGEGKFVDHPKTAFLLGDININGKRCVINDDEFKLPIYYNILLGYQSPDEIDSIDKKEPGFEKRYRSKYDEKAFRI